MSWIFLKVRYKLLHIIGVSICLVGVGCLVWADIEEGRGSVGGELTPGGRHTCRPPALTHPDGETHPAHTCTVLRWCRCAPVNGTRAQRPVEVAARGETLVPTLTQRPVEVTVRGRHWCQPWLRDLYTGCFKKIGTILNISHFLIVLPTSFSFSIFGDVLSFDVAEVSVPRRNSFHTRRINQNHSIFM